MRLAAAALLCLVPAAALADAPADMAAAANGFYAAYGKVKRLGGVPDAAARTAYAPYLSARLSQQLNQAAAAEAAYTKKFKAVPPLFEGDLFTSQFEGATGWTVQSCSGDARAGRCKVALRYDRPGQKPVSWTDTLLLVNTPSGWKIDDVAYDAGFAFGNSGKLSETMAMVLAQAGR
jgi:hypothetical protein